MTDAAFLAAFRLVFGKRLSARVERRSIDRNLVVYFLFSRLHPNGYLSCVAIPCGSVLSPDRIAAYLVENRLCSEFDVALLAAASNDASLGSRAWRVSFDEEWAAEMG